MAEIILHLLNIFALKTGQTSLKYEGKTVGEVISQFVEEYKNKLDKNLLNKTKTCIHPQILVLLDGKDIKHKKNYNTKLKDGDKLYLSFPISGG